MPEELAQDEETTDAGDDAVSTPKKRSLPLQGGG